MIKLLLTVAVSMAGCFGLYVLYQNKKTEKEAQKRKEKAEALNAFPLKKGSCGDRVLQLKKALNKVLAEIANGEEAERWLPQYNGEPIKQLSSNEYFDEQTEAVINDKNTFFGKKEVDEELYNALIKDPITAVYA